MMQRSHPILHLALLAAITLRMVVGAPCCMDPVSAASHSLDAAAQSHHAHHGDHSGDAATQSDKAAPSHGGHEGHAGHEGDNTANPCCSACGPTLPADPVQLGVRSAPRSVPEATKVRALATRPPFPAYDARGPPSRV